ncbi:hypothetical protein APR12_004934 [Nocardia amikacinitolerans]|uniref:hypothetical protein n=1 Tax=Nocardia amikacinitolerans TaxID=756689 RepID=UPI00082A5AC6|nr:hypothetical protein [Nocardia amikacinitolerans]MCP2319565.1 hypothetical protein [Nocardia amikacinitolerans]
MGLLSATVPNFSDPSTAPVLQRRWPSARRLLYVSYLLIPAIIVVIFALLATPSQVPIGSEELAPAMVCLAGVSAPAFAALIWLRLVGLRNWRYWGMAVVSTSGQWLTGVVLSLLVFAPDSGGLLPEGSVVVAVALSLVAWICAVKARHRLIEPLTVELGDLDLDIVLTRERLPSFSNGRSIEVTVRDNQIIIRSQRTGFAERRRLDSYRMVTIPFEDIRSIQPWSAKPNKPWFVDLDGYSWYPEDSETIVVRSAYPTTDTVIPVADAHVAAEVLNRRLHQFRSTPL